LAAKQLIKIYPGILIDPIVRREFADREESRHLLLDDLGLKHIGLEKRHMKTLSRLSEGGYITITRISPKVWFLDMDSWDAHLRRVTEDPWYWDRDGKHLHHYRQTYRNDLAEAL